MLYWQLQFLNEIALNCLFTHWKWSCILDFGSWRWNALTMRFVEKWPSKMQGQWLFQSRTGHATNFGRVQKFRILVFAGLPQPGSDTSWKFTGGLFNILPNEAWPWHCINNVRIQNIYTDYLHSKTCMWSSVTIWYKYRVLRTLVRDLSISNCMKWGTNTREVQIPMLIHAHSWVMFLACTLTNV